MYDSANHSFHVFAGYSTGDLDDDFGNSADFDELSIGLGHHLSLSEQVDLVSSVSYEYVDISSGGAGVDDTGFGAGLLYNVNDSIAVGVNGSWTDDASSYGIGGRFYFDR